MGCNKGVSALASIIPHCWTAKSTKMGASEQKSVRSLTLNDLISNVSTLTQLEKPSHGRTDSSVRAEASEVSQHPPSRHILYHLTIFFSAQALVVFASGDTMSKSVLEHVNLLHTWCITYCRLTRGSKCIKGIANLASCPTFQ